MFRQLVLMFRSLRLRIMLSLIGAMALALAVFGIYGHELLVDELESAFATQQSVMLTRVAQNAAGPLLRLDSTGLGGMLRIELGVLAEMRDLPERTDRELGEVDQAFIQALRRIRQEAKRQESMLEGKARAGEFKQLLQQASGYPEFGRELLEYLAPKLGARVKA